MEKQADGGQTKQGSQQIGITPPEHIADGVPGDQSRRRHPTGIFTGDALRQARVQRIGETDHAQEKHQAETPANHGGCLRTV